MEIRGIGGTCKATIVNKLLREKCLDFLGLAETKHSSIDEKIIRSWWGGDVWVGVMWRQIMVAVDLFIVRKRTLSVTR